MGGGGGRAGAGTARPVRGESAPGRPGRREGAAGTGVRRGAGAAERGGAGGSAAARSSGRPAAGSTGGWMRHGRAGRSRCATSRARRRTSGSRAARRCVPGASCSRRWAGSSPLSCRCQPGARRAPRSAGCCWPAARWAPRRSGPVRAAAVLTGTCRHGGAVPPQTYRHVGAVLTCVRVLASYFPADSPPDSVRGYPHHSLRALSFSTPARPSAPWLHGEPYTANVPSRCAVGVR